jgi:hypothetical protein
LSFTLPSHKRSVHWQPILDTAVTARSEKSITILNGGEQYELEGRSIAILRLHDER